MRRTCLTVVACTAASIGFSFAQENIKADTTEALGAEWQDSKNALHCLTALGLYTQFTRDPESDAKEALKELQAGDGDARHQELFKVAQEQPDFLNWLASATPKSYKVPDDETLFTQAKAVIAKVYTGQLDALSGVHKSSQAQYYALALFQLLNTYRTSTITLDDMQTLRAAYKNPKRLFKIVDDRFDPPKS
jgi:endonuclease/exonuclease/phosphatase (EEP) superfamily protein YafD